MASPENAPREIPWRGDFTLIVLCFLFVCLMGWQMKMRSAPTASAAEPKHELVTALEDGVYVIDVRDAMNDQHLGWAPLLIQFIKDHRDRRVVAVSPASISGGRGTMNSVVIVTEPR